MVVKYFDNIRIAIAQRKVSRNKFVNVFNISLINAKSEGCKWALTPYAHTHTHTRTHTHTHSLSLSHTLSLSLSLSLWISASSTIPLFTLAPAANNARHTWGRFFIAAIIRAVWPCKSWVLIHADSNAGEDWRMTMAHWGKPSVHATCNAVRPS